MDNAEPYPDEVEDYDPDNDRNLMMTDCACGLCDCINQVYMGGVCNDCINFAHAG